MELSASMAEYIINSLNKAKNEVDKTMASASRIAHKRPSSTADPEVIKRFNDTFGTVVELVNRAKTAYVLLLKMANDHCKQAGYTVVYHESENRHYLCHM